MILHEKKVVDAEPENVGDGFPLSPLACVFILIGITCFVGWLQFKTRKIIWIWDLLLFGVQGLAGCVITFLVFFSTHPTVGSNWLILLLNPIPLLYLPVMVCRAIKGKKDLYHTINVVYLTLFYNDNAVCTAKIQCNGITFGTVFVDMFCKPRFYYITEKQ